MSDYNTQTPPRPAGVQYVEPAPRGGNGSIAFIVGGLVVAVVILFWAMSDGTSVTTTPADPDTSISIDNSALPPAETVDPNAMQAAPADDAAPAMDAAPADDAAPSAMDAAPADDGAVAPADPVAPADDATTAPANP